jgi:hypothetical protein
MKAEERMNNVWTESADRVRPLLVHSADTAATLFIPRNLRCNTMIPQTNPELSRSGASPVSYQLI